MIRPPALQNFIDAYQSLGTDNLQQLQAVYSEDVVFRDALHETRGLVALLTYFESLYTHLLYCRFVIDEIQHDDNSAFLNWTMHYSHRRLAGQKEIVVEGVTHLKFTDKVTYHRDYADMGQMLYEHLPLLGSAIRFIKKRAVQ